MSSGHDNHGHAESSSGGGVLSAMNKLISPQRGPIPPTILDQCYDTVSQLFKLFRSGVSTTAGIPLGVTSMALAVPNNLIGLGVQAFDRWIVTPIDDARLKIASVLSGTGGSSASAGHR